MPGYVRFSKSTPGRELTPALWAKALEAHAIDPSVGTFRFEDFLVDRVNVTDATAELGWFIQDAAAGGTAESFIGTEGVDGRATLSASTGTDHFGIEAHYGATATSIGIIELPTSTTDARGDVIFECRVSLTDATQWFIGLTEPIVEFLGATSLLPTNSDYIGFFRSDAGAIQFVSANDNNGGTAVANAVTLIAAAAATTLQATGYIKLGFRVNKDQIVDVYVNGTSYRSTIKNGESFLATGLPIEALTYKFGLYRDATGDNATVAAIFDYVASFVAAA